MFHPSSIKYDLLGNELSSGKDLDNTVATFFRMSQKERAQSYHKTHPHIPLDSIMEALSRRVHFLQWSGSDILHATDYDGKKTKIVLETNSCPSGALDFPTNAYKVLGATPYEIVLREALLPKINGQGELAVIWDKNRRGTRGYAQVLSNLTGRNVHWFSLLDSEEFRFTINSHLMLNNRNIEAAFRYVTQNPWERIPIDTETHLVNPIIACVAGGRNKNIAALAYSHYNNRNPLKIHLPFTTEEMSRDDAIQTLQGWSFKGVIKNPYSNAGQGVFTITYEEELESFIQSTSQEEMFIVQQIVGDEDLSSNTGAFRHIGTLPVNGHRFAFDIRMMIVNGKDGFRPVATYARRARAPLGSRVNGSISTWDVLGTNLSVRLGEDKWRYDEATRQIIASPEAFPILGLTVDDLVEVYVQSVASNIAINEMAESLTQEGHFNRELFSQLNPDQQFNRSIL